MTKSCRCVRTDRRYRETLPVLNPLFLSPLSCAVLGPGPLQEFSSVEDWPWRLSTGVICASFGGMLWLERRPPPGFPEGGAAADYQLGDASAGRFYTSPFPPPPLPVESVAETVSVQWWPSSFQFRYCAETNCILFHIPSFFPSLYSICGHDCLQR